MFDHPDCDNHERVVWFRDAATGLRGVIAVHSTARGPAMGGCRLWRYDTAEAALGDALRLSRGMSYKNAMADLPLGGGKAVLMGPVAPEDREAAFAAFGRAVDGLGGAYVTAEDVGVSVADMRAAATQTAHVSGTGSAARGGGGDPSPHTARGVLRGMEAAVERVLGAATLAGVRVAVQGAGHVGGALCALLATAGARVEVADAEPARARAVADRTGAQVVAPEAIAATGAEVFAPCALGGVLTGALAGTLGARIVAGAANNQLAAPDVAARLHDRGIVYVPDYVLNAGGIVAVAAEHRGGWNDAAVAAAVDAIGPRVADILARAGQEARPPAEIADAMARERLAAG